MILAGIAPLPMPPRLILSLMAAAGIGFGAILLLRGRRHGAWVLCAAFVAATLLNSPALDKLLPLHNVYVIGALLSVVAAVLGYFLARLWWAAILGLVLAAVAAAVAIRFYPGGLKLQAAWPEGIVDWQGWLAAAGGVLAGWPHQLWGINPMFFVLVGGVAWLIGLTLGLIYPRFFQVLLTSLFGGALAATGICLGLWDFRPDWGGAIAARWWLAMAVAAGVAALGISVQCYAEFGKKDKSNDKAAPDNVGGQA